MKKKSNMIMKMKQTKKTKRPQKVLRLGKATRTIFLGEGNNSCLPRFGALRCGAV